MANPFYVEPPNLNSALQQLMQGYQFTSGLRKQGETEAARREAGDALASGGDTRSAIGRLLGIGDVQGAQVLGSLGKADTTDEIKEYNLDMAQRRAQGMQPVNFGQWKTALKQAGATRVNTNVNTDEGFSAAQTKARISLDTDAAKDIQKQAIAGMRLSPLLNQIEALADKTPSGMAGRVSASLAKLATTAGIDVPEGWTNAELLQSISQRLVPIVREPGPTSEKELAMYLDAVPGLMQSPEGRKKIVRMTRQINQRAQDIARVYRTHIGAPDLAQRLSSLDKPIFSPGDLAAPADDGWQQVAPNIRIREKR